MKNIPSSEFSNGKKNQTVVEIVKRDEILVKKQKSGSEIRSGLAYLASEAVKDVCTHLALLPPTLVEEHQVR